jgi:ABC-type nitrate/sulfonate/bicarbonate transport system substrate-binding protein
MTKQLAWALTLTLAAGALAGCAGGGGSATDADGRATVRVALDWTPNTNHTGLYAAIANGYYEDAGLNVEILPFNSNGAEAALASGDAEFGYCEAAIAARAAGQKLKAVEVVEAKPVVAYGYVAERADLASPADLDGKVYAGFGGPAEEAQVKTMIKTAGGAGEFDTVLLSTSSYEAVYAGQADFTSVYIPWEGVEAELRGTPFAYFRPAEYGVPPYYQLVIAAQDDYLAANGEAAAKFVQATQRGYAFAADNPAEAAELLLAANPEVLKDAELVNRSQELLSREYYRDDAGRIGFSDPAVWANYLAWFSATGLLTDTAGQPLTAPLNPTDLYTNDYLDPKIQ